MAPAVADVICRSFKQAAHAPCHIADRGGVDGRSTDILDGSRSVHGSMAKASQPYAEAGCTRLTPRTQSLVIGDRRLR